MKLFLILTCFNISVFAADLKFEKAWVRAVPEVSEVSAGFGIVINATNRDRKLVRIESNISKTVELHTHKKRRGVMKMRPVEFIKVKKNSFLELKRLSYHIMFIGLIKPLKISQKVPLKLFFDNGEIIEQAVEVKKM